MPSLGFKDPATKLNKVLFPEPLGPMIPVIEPLLILMVGAVIALMVVLTYLPVFHLGSALQSGL